MINTGEMQGRWTTRAYWGIYGDKLVRIGWHEKGNGGNVWVDMPRGRLVGMRLEKEKILNY